MATAGVQAVIRQTLLGNTYQLINSTTLTPNPSYWLVYLWRRLVGHRALAFSTDAPLPAPLRASVHCTPAAEEDVAEAGNARNTSATAVVINFATSVSYDIDLLPASGGENTSSEPLSVFLLTGDVYGKTVRLNGKTLRVEGGYVPEIDPHRIDGPLRMPPASIAFVRGAWDVPACQRMTMS